MWTCTSLNLPRCHLPHATCAALRASRLDRRVAFHPKDPRTLAASCTDGNVTVVHTDGTVVRRLHHPSIVSGISWCPHNPDLLASTSTAGHVYLWDLTRPASDCLIRTLEGHRCASRGGGAGSGRCHDPALRLGACRGTFHVPCCMWGMYGKVRAGRSHFCACFLWRLTAKG